MSQPRVTKRMVLEEMRRRHGEFDERLQKLEHTLQNLPQQNQDDILKRLNLAEQKLIILRSCLNGVMRREARDNNVLHLAGMEKEELVRKMNEMNMEKYVTFRFPDDEPEKK